ncbi:MAG: protoporphyrinogen oxidase [candidate division Zixibacteria bacterium]|nr:protoporphyrinogen oxidase [candidate division Zixibacteria bacterium]
MSKLRIAVAGGGISGLSAGIFIRERYGDRAEFVIFERGAVPGGTIQVTRETGYIADWGSNGFLDREPLTLEFIRHIGLSDKLYPSNQKSAKRFIFRDNRLWEISAKPQKFLTSGLLSLGGRLRCAGEYFGRPKRNDRDESIFDFGVRRIGREAAEMLIDPMVSGVFGGDSTALSLASCFPRMEQMERQYGSLTKAMLAKKKESKGKKPGGPAGPSGHLTSFTGGLYTLIEHLQTKLHDNLRTDSPVVSITRNTDRTYTVQTESSSETFDRVILAIPSYQAADILADFHPELAKQLYEIPYADIAVICQGYKISTVGCPLDGFGFLVPHNQGRDILGSIWTSTIFPEQAPAGYVLFRTMVGGARRADLVARNEASLNDLVHRELSSILAITSEPVFRKVIRWQRAIPQYVIGHSGRLKRIDDYLAGFDGLYLAGNAYIGVGLNDAIKRSYHIVTAMHERDRDKIKTA